VRCDKCWQTEPDSSGTAQVDSPRFSCTHLLYRFAIAANEEWARQALALLQGGSQASSQGQAHLSFGAGAITRDGLRDGPATMPDEPVIAACARRRSRSGLGCIFLHPRSLAS